MILCNVMVIWLFFGKLGNNLVVPAKAGGRPAGTTEVCASATLMFLLTKYSYEPALFCKT